MSYQLNINMIISGWNEWGGPSCIKSHRNTEGSAWGKQNCRL